MFLTPNHRLALLLTKEYRQPVIAFSTWIERLWQALQLERIESQQSIPTLLSPVAQVSLFEKIIKTSALDYPLLRIEATAKLAAEAWNLCQQWHLNYSEHWANTEDTRSYWQWAESYRELCRANHWIDTAGLLNYITDAIQKNQIQLPAQITCFGFMEYTAQQNHFLAICEKRGTQVERHPSLKMNSRSEVRQIGLSDEEEELKTALKQTKTWLIENPGCRIGVIVPDLEQKRFAVLRLLKTLCPPETYNVAAPVALAQYPMIDAALLGLSLLQTEISFKDFSKVLRLAFFARDIEQSCQMAVFETKLRHEASHQHSLAEYVFFIEQIQRNFLKGQDCSFVLNFKQALELRTEFLGHKTSDVWQNLFTKLLNCLGWPGGRTLTAEEQALAQHWQEVLQEYGQMGAFLEKHSYEEALKHVRALAQHRKFLLQNETQESSIDAPIQVLGLLEGLGFPFDYLWVLGLHRDTWPKEPAPNPFIPLSAQVVQQLPRSSAARELQIAERMTEQFAAGAKKVILSYPLVVGEQPTAMSPLLSGFPAISDLGVGEKDPEVSSVVMQEKEVVTSLYGPSVASDTVVRGGSKILNLQAVCPFRAFSEIRLKAEPLKTPQLGFTAAERGELLHQVLRLFWQDLPSQAALIALTETEQQNRVEQAMTQTFGRWKQGALDAGFAERYTMLERDRIAVLVQRFLLLERRRPAFTVLAHELSQELVLGGLRFKLRIDRIDQLENGDELLIDYKTGLVQISEWFGDRPLAPQLPLYCIARKTKVSGVAYAIIRPDEVRYRGLIADATTENDGTRLSHEQTIPGIDVASKLKRYGAEENWQEQKAVWERNLENLALEFKEGRAAIEPLKGEYSCSTCHLRSFCRWNF